MKNAKSFKLREFLSYFRHHIHGHLTHLDYQLQPHPQQVSRIFDVRSGFKLGPDGREK